MATTIKDVAKLANVAISTVSRVTNNAENVNEEIRMRVKKAIEELNYEPNRIAQSLSGSPFKAIGIAASRSSNPEYTSKILYGIGEYIQERGYSTILNYSKNNEDELEQCQSMVKGAVVQGMILLGAKHDDRLSRRLLELNIPFVVIGQITNETISDKVYQVDTDNISDSKEAVSYLTALNHKKIACVYAGWDYVSASARTEGYILALREKNIEINPYYLADGGFSAESAYLAARELLLQKDRPTAIFATDDIKAIGCYKAANDLGLKIPEDLSIVGHNNYELSGVLTPTLTTVNVPISDLGNTVARVICDLIEEKKVEKRIILPTNLIIRNSCKKI